MKFILIDQGTYRNSIVREVGQLGSMGHGLVSFTHGRRIAVWFLLLTLHKTRQTDTLMIIMSCWGGSFAMSWSPYCHFSSLSEEGKERRQKNRYLTRFCRSKVVSNFNKQNLELYSNFFIPSTSVLHLCFDQSKSKIEIPIPSSLSNKDTHTFPTYTAERDRHLGT